MSDNTNTDNYDEGTEANAEDALAGFPDDPTGRTEAQADRDADSAEDDIRASGADPSNA